MLNHLTIKARLLLLLILPILGIGGFSSLIITDKWARFSTSKQLIKDCDFFVAIGELVHNLQKERGTTVAFVASKGAKMADKLPALRTETDESLTALILAMNIRSNEENKDTENTLTQLHKIPALRYQAYEFGIAWSNIIIQYTVVVNALLELSSITSKEVKDDKIMRSANTYLSYINAKERAGRERAMLSGVFTANKLDADNLLKISVNFSEYNAGFNQFKQLSTPEQLDFHHKTVVGKPLSEVERLRKQALESPLGTPLGVDSRYWVNMSTARIDMMKTVEDKLVADLRGSARTIQASALRELIAVSIIALLVISFTFVLMIRVIRSIEHSSRSLRTSIEGLAAGDLNVNIQHLNVQNEMGAVARALKILQNVCRNMQTQDWVKENAARITAQLQQLESFSKLPQNFISAVCPLLKVGYGSFYLYAENQLRLAGSYGYPDANLKNSFFKLGEGLVGQCAMEKTPITLTDSPPDYLKISSGLGEAKATAIMLQPVLRNNRLFGVLELASFQAFTEAENTLLDTLIPVLAVNMEILERNFSATQRQEDSQAQVDFMEALAGKLELQTIELQTQHDAIRQTEAWFRGLIEAAPEAMLITDEAGFIMLCNPKATEMFGYSSGELLSKSIEQLITANHGLRKNGTEFPLEITISHLPSFAGKAAGICTSLREIKP